MTIENKYFLGLPFVISFAFWFCSYGKVFYVSYPFPMWVSGMREFSHESSPTSMCLILPHVDHFLKLLQNLTDFRQSDLVVIFPCLSNILISFRDFAMLLSSLHFRSSCFLFFGLALSEWTHVKQAQWPSSPRPPLHSKRGCTFTVLANASWNSAFYEVQTLEA